MNPTGPLNELLDNSSAIQNNTVHGDTETLILANAVTRVIVSSGILIAGALYLIPNATEVIVRIRRGYGTTGIIDWEIPFVTNPGKLNVLPIAGVMQPTEYLNNDGQHTVTVQQVKSTADAHMVYASVAYFNTIVQGMGVQI